MRGKNAWSKTKWSEWLDRLDMRGGEQWKMERSVVLTVYRQSDKELCGFREFAVGSALVKKLTPQLST